MKKAREGIHLSLSIYEARYNQIQKQKQKHTQIKTRKQNQKWKHKRRTAPCWDICALWVRRWLYDEAQEFPNKSKSPEIPKNAHKMPQNAPKIPKRSISVSDGFPMFPTVFRRFSDGFPTFPTVLQRFFVCPKTPPKNFENFERHPKNSQTAAILQAKFSAELFERIPFHIPFHIRAMETPQGALKKVGSKTVGSKKIGKKIVLGKLERKGWDKWERRSC